MNFIYDILVNFNNNLYDFYEWNVSDNVSHIRKMPLFKVKTEVLEKIKDYSVKIDIDFLRKIENRTEKFTSRDIEKVEYAALFSDCNDVIAVKFTRDGINKYLSKLLVDEQEEVIEVCNRCSETNIELEIIKLREKNNFKTRMQVEKMNYLLKSLKLLEKNRENEKLKYLYFECFDEKQDSVNIILDKLKKAIDNEKVEKTMYDFFKLISIN